MTTGLAYESQDTRRAALPALQPSFVFVPGSLQVRVPDEEVRIPLIGCVPRFHRVQAKVGDRGLMVRVRDKGASVTSSAPRLDLFHVELVL